jgi:tetratricopeptide (TPR) repeat protein
MPAVMAILDGTGDLAKVPLAAVLIEALNLRATGVLTVEHGGGASRVFLRDGIPAGSQSFTGFRPLGQALLAHGVIDVEALSRSLAEMARTGKPQGELLVEMGLATQAQVDLALSEQQGAYLAHIAGLATGRFRFDAAAPIPPWTAGIRIRPLAAIVEALEKPQANALVVAALQPIAGGPIALAPGYDHLAGAFGWSAPEEALVARLHVVTTLDAFFAEPGVAPERARAILAALLLLGLAQSRGATHDAVDTVTGVVVDLADLAGVAIHAVLLEAQAGPVAEAAAPAPACHAGGATPAVPRRPLRRSDPEEARRRRQRLLQRAMQNMGVGPLWGAPPSASARAAAGAAAPPRPGPGPGPTPTPTPTPVEEELRRALDAAAPRARSADLFERLGLERGATREQVKAAYFGIAKQLHPDRFAAPALADVAVRVKDLFAAVNEAYEVLSDDRKRAEYLARAPAGPEDGAATDAERGQAAVDYEKAEACVRTRDHVRARGFFEAALRADPRPDFQASYAWALLCEPRAPDRARARTLAMAALRDPACDRAAFVCGIIARDEGDDERAERLFRQALARNPRNADAGREIKAVEARRGGKATRGLSDLFRKR